MVKWTFLILVFLAALLAFSWLFLSDWYREHRLPSKEFGGEWYRPDHPFPHLACKVWKTGADELYYAVSIGHADFDPNTPALTCIYSYNINKGGALLVNGQRIRYSATKRLLALGPFGEMVEVQLTDVEAGIVAAADAGKIWETVVLPRLYRFKGELQDNKRIGHWVCCDAEGRKAWEGDYASGLRDGEWVYFYPSGTVKAQIGYVKGKRNGKWSYFSLDGALQDSLTWKDDVPLEHPATTKGFEFTETVYPRGNSE